MEDLSQYLRATKYCDCENKMLRGVVNEIIGDISEPTQRAVSIFYFVRDSIKSGMDRFDVKASETLTKCFGGCVGKANLQIALMRAGGIPARYAAVSMRKEVLNPLNTFGLSRLAFSKIPELLPHVVCSVNIENKWLFAESAFDKEMFSLFFKPNKNWEIDWTGREDLLVADEYFVGGFKYFDSMDEQFSKNFNMLPPLFLTGPMFSVANVYSNRLRRMHREDSSEFLN